MIICPTADMLPETKKLLGLLPSVQLIRKDKTLRTDFVGLDDKNIVYEATRHLLELGHMQIAFVGGHPKLSTTCDRFEGYRTALAEAGIVPDKRLVVFGPPRAEFGGQALTEMLGIGMPATGVIATTVQQTIGLLLAARTAGICIPERLSVVGFGDPMISKLMAPPLTTIEIPAHEIGAAALSLLFQRIQDVDAEGEPRNSTNIRISADLVVRDSTAIPFRSA